MITAIQFISENEEYYMELDWNSVLEKALIEFAKIHVEAALERAYENQGMSWTNSKDENVKKELFFKNSYPLTNIK